MSLTEDQIEFLNNFLKSDLAANKKGKFGGKTQNEMIKAAYEDFLRRKGKVEGLIEQLKSLPNGEAHSKPFLEQMGKLDEKLEKAKENSDESVFPEGYKELGTLKGEVRKKVEARQKEIKAANKAVTEFAKALSTGLDEKSKGKGTGKLEMLKVDLVNWLASHHTEDAPSVFSIYEKCADAIGDDPTSQDLTLICRQIEQEVVYAVAPFENVKDEELPATLLETGSMGPRLFDLIERVESYLESAERFENKMATEQCKRFLVQLKNLHERLHGVDDSVIAPTKKDEPISDLLESKDDVELIKDQKEEEKPKEKPQVVLETDDAETALGKTAKAIEIFIAAKKKATTVVDEFEDTVDSVENDAATFLKYVQEDIDLLKVCIVRARNELKDAQKRLDQCNREQKIGEQEKNDELKWKTSTRNIGIHLGEGRQFLEKATYQIGLGEGGVVHTQNIIDSFESIKTRLVALDETTIDTVTQKQKLLPECKKVAGANADAIEMITRLAFVSALPENKIRALLALPGQGRNEEEKAKKLDQVFQGFIQGPQLSTLELTSVLTNSHQLVLDVSRFFANQTVFADTLDEKLKPKWTKVLDLAKQDLGSLLAPVVYVPGKGGDEIKQKSQYPSVGVAVVGGGPIGLLAAVEARLRGAVEVHVYEGRIDPYSRLNVLKFTEPSIQRMKQVGVYDAIWPKGSPGPASVKTIENALESRCNQLGIKLERGKFLSNVMKDENGKTLLYFKGEEDSPKSCDLMVLATGASITSAKKHADAIPLSEKLGIPFQKSEVVDLAAVGVFTKAEGEVVDDGEERNVGDGWAYAFRTDDVDYVVTQLSEDEFNEFTKHPEKLRERVRDDASRAGLGRNRPEVFKQFGKEVVQQFPIEIQQALVFAKEELNVVLIGDSAGTPHPSTALGLNTGVAEMGALGDLVDSLETGNPDDPEVKKKAMQLYDWEVKRKTDNMVNSAMNKMVELAFTRCTGYVDAVKMTLSDIPDENKFIPSYEYMVACTTPFKKELGKLKPSDEEIKEDLSWAVREEATKKLRGMEDKIKDAVVKARNQLTEPVTQEKINAAWIELKKVFD